MKKNKKPLFVIIILLLVIGGTYALFSSSSMFENDFTVGNYDVVTNETISSPSDWMPGDTITKSITATNNGNKKAAFRVKYTESWEDSDENDITSSVPNDAVIINFTNQDEWIYDSTDGYYYYKYVVEPNEVTSSFISGVTLNSNLYGNENCSMDGDTYNCTDRLDGVSNANYKINFTKETVQYDKYKEFWGTDTLIREYFACPGENCVYTGYQDKILGNRISDSDYNADYSLYGARMKSAYGLVVDNGVIDDVYVCYYDKELFCLKGGVDETSLNDKKAYNKNLDVLRTVFPNCTINSNNSYNFCTKNYDTYKIDAYVYQNGVVRVNVYNAFDFLDGFYEVGYDLSENGTYWDWVQFE